MSSCFIFVDSKQPQNPQKFEASKLNTHTLPYFLKASLKYNLRVFMTNLNAGYTMQGLTCLNSCGPQRRERNICSGFYTKDLS